MAAGGRTSPTPVAKANAEAEWPEGNEVEDGIRTCRATGTCSTARSGRRRWPSGFRPRFTTVAATPTEANPIVAARLPRRPAVAARTAAETTGRRGEAAARGSPALARSGGGGGGFATAA